MFQKNFLSREEPKSTMNLKQRFHEPWLEHYAPCMNSVVLYLCLRHYRSKIEKMKVKQMSVNQLSTQLIDPRRSTSMIITCVKPIKSEDTQCNVFSSSNGSVCLIVDSLVLRRMLRIWDLLRGFMTGLTGGRVSGSHPSPSSVEVFLYALMMAVGMDDLLFTAISFLK